MSWKQRFPIALQHYLRDIHGVDTQGEKELFQKIRDLDNQQRRGIWAVISEILDILPQDAHDYYHNTWTKQFFDPIDSIKSKITEIVQKNAERAETKKDLVQLSLETIKEQFPDKNFHQMSIKQYLHHQINRTAKFGDRRKNKFIKTSDDISQQKILALVSMFLTGEQ